MEIPLRQIAVAGQTDPHGAAALRVSVAVANRTEVELGFLKHRDLLERVVLAKKA